MPKPPIYTAPDESLTGSLTISPDKVCFVIVKAREFEVKDVVTEPDPGSNPADDKMIAVLEDRGRRSGPRGVAVVHLGDERGRADRPRRAGAWPGRQHDRGLAGDPRGSGARPRLANGSYGQLPSRDALVSEYLEEGLSLFGSPARTPSSAASDAGVAAMRLFWNGWEVSEQQTLRSCWSPSWSALHHAARRPRRWECRTWPRLRTESMRECHAVLPNERLLEPTRRYVQSHRQYAGHDTDGTGGLVPDVHPTMPTSSSRRTTGTT